MKIRKKVLYKVIILFISIAFFTVSIFSKFVYMALDIKFFDYTYHYLLITSVICFLLIVVKTLINNKIHKGLKYFWYHIKLKNKLENQLIDANFYITRNNYIEVPEIKIYFSKDLSAGKLLVENSLKFEDKLNNKIISSALGRYVVEKNYLSNDENYYVYEIIDSEISHKITFNSFNEFKVYNDKISQYELFLDKRTNVKIQSALIVGATGFGKTNALYNIILQMLNKKIKYNIYFADLKNSSLAVLGNKINENRTAENFNEIVEKLYEFNISMNERKIEMKKQLQNSLNSDYRNFNMEPYVFIFDEYASFTSILQTCDKKTRDKINKLIFNIILQGRQLGYFLIIAMQKSDSNLINTIIRDNLTLKIALGNNEETTYITIFGKDFDLKKYNFQIGQGVFTEPSISHLPKKVDIPYLNFNILNAILFEGV